MVITYSPKYAAYQKQIRNQQIERAEKMIRNGSCKKQRKNPNDPARFINKFAVTGDGECADIHYELDTEKIEEESPDSKYTCDQILSKLKEMNFADIEKHGFMPLYKRDKLTDELHEICGFRTDYQFISKRTMKNIQKKSKGRE